MKSKISTITLLTAMLLLSYISMFYAWKSYIALPINYLNNEQVIELQFGADYSNSQGWHKYLLDNNFNSIYYSNLNEIAVHLADSDNEFYNSKQEPPDIMKFLGNKGGEIKTPSLAVEDAWADKYFLQEDKPCVIVRDNYKSVYEFQGTINKNHPWLRKASYNIIPLNYSLTMQGDWFIGVDSEDDVSNIKDYLHDNNIDYKLVRHEQVSKIAYLFSEDFYKTITSYAPVGAVTAMLALILDLASKRKIEQRNNAVRYLVGATKARDIKSAYLKYLQNFLISTVIAALIVAFLEMGNWISYPLKNILIQFQAIGFVAVFLLTSLIYLLTYALSKYLPGDIYA